MSTKFDFKYFPQLDGLRGVAIILVILFHAKVPFLSGGYIGVDIFFVLSGFLISSLIIKEFENKGKINLKLFYIKRIRRLFPALIFFLFLYILASFLLLSTKESYENFLDSIISLLYMTNWFQAFEIREMTLIKHTWSLSIEEQFYLIWPIILYLTFKMNIKIKYLLIFIIILSLTSWIWRNYLIVFESKSFIRIYSGLDTRFDGLMLGCALAVLFNFYHHRISAINKIFISFLSTISLIYLLFIIVEMSWLDIRMFTLHFYMVAISSGLIIYYILINPESITCKFLKNTFLVEIGKLSYGLYLWHYPIFRILRVDNSPLVVVLIGGGLSLILALLSFHFVEKKFYYRQFHQQYPFVKIKNQPYR